MGAKPQASDGQLRRLVREVLATAPGYAFTDALLLRGVRELLPLNAAEDSEILNAATWNLGKEYVATSTDEDTDERAWRITNHGMAKQSLT